MIKVFTDDTHRAVQAKELAKRLPQNAKIAIGVGAEAATKVLAEKNNGYFTVQILDPQTRYDEFDMLVLPAHEPYKKGKNVITTFGLINHITPERLGKKDIKDKCVSVLIGGKHIGGNFSVGDATALAEIINKIDAKIYITTSHRTESASRDALKDMAKHDAFYDYNYDQHIENPYEDMLKRADAIIVTADSARMVSESCSSGKPVYIFAPKQTHFAYLDLRDVMVENGCANAEFSFDQTKILNEAERIAQSILARYLSLK